MKYNYFLHIAFAAFCLYSCGVKMPPVKNTQPMEQANSESKLFNNSSALKRISNQFLFTEGPAADRKGNVFFTDQPNNKIWKYATDGTLSVFMENAGRSNGLFFDKDDYLYACADEHNELWRISPDKKIEVLVRDVDGKKLNGPNDVWVDGNKNIYFTDPYYQRDYWTRKKPELREEKVYVFSPNKTLKVAADGFNKPNGIVGSVETNLLYIADIGANKTYRYTLQPNGSLSNKMLFAEQGSDGMTLDNQGNLYLTGNGVTIYNKEGKKIDHIAVPEKWTANVCFGGKNYNQLFITASNSLYMMEMNVKGVR